MNPKYFFIAWTFLLLGLYSCAGTFGKKPVALNKTVIKADIVVYGGASAAIAAAVQATRLGKKVVVVSPDKYLGGLAAGGSGFTSLQSR